MPARRRGLAKKQRLVTARRVWVAPLAAILLLMMASPSWAIDGYEGGRRGYNFPKHDCVNAVPTHVDLYMHTWTGIFGPRLDGRIRYYSGTCSKAAAYMHIYSITLWQYIGSSWRSMASSG